MTQIRISGRLLHRVSSIAAINKIALTTYARHLFGRRMAPDWDANFEIGIRFWRHQFTRAMTHRDFAEGRALFDSLQTETDDVYRVTSDRTDTPMGRWLHPGARENDAVVLYLHGGGYAFHGAMSHRFAAMLAHRLGMSVFAPDYRLTPEHPHPAQAEDALAAWRYMTDRVAPERVVVIGDSAGGHMALMLLQRLKADEMRQPALCIGLCPWTDIGDRGDSLRSNDRFDLVQGWMALQFGEWLDPSGRFGRAALSPVNHDYSGLAPLYLQAGGREVLRDMIVDFARIQAGNGADVLLDLWPDMPHDFQAYDSLTRSSTEALERIRDVIAATLKGDVPSQCAQSVVRGGAFA